MIYGLSYLFLKAFYGVSCGDLEIFLVSKVFYFCVVVLGLEYDKGISFISSGDHGVIFFEFCLNLCQGSLFRMVVALCVGFVMKF